MKGSFRRCANEIDLLRVSEGNCLYRTVAIYPQNTSDDRNVLGEYPFGSRARRHLFVS